MKPLSTWIALAIVMCGLVLLGRSPSALAAPSGTSVCSNINANTTWTVGGSPYNVCPGVAIAAGVTVTVQSGVTVVFSNTAGLNVHGNLLALGTPTQPITFTGAIASPGSWLGISADGAVLTPAVVSLDQVTLDYGGTNAVAYGAQVYGDHATLNVRHSRLLNGQRHGLYATQNAHVDLESTALTGNAGDAVHLIQPPTGLALGGLTASGNGLNAIYVGGTTYWHGQQHWPAAGIPYVVDGLLGNFAGDSLTIDPGNELQFTSSGVLNIAGDFHAVGLPAAPITLTAQVKTLVGAWAGLVLYGTTLVPANGELDYVTLEYGGRAADGADIAVTNGYVMAQNAIIRHSWHDGVRVNSRGHSTVLNSQIVSNAGYGVRNTTAPQSVLASNDWWGNLNGPTADTSACSPGHGDKVTNGVLFRPVLTSTTSSAIVPLTDAPSLSLSPQRWFAPDDSQTKIFFDIHVADGNGAPLPNRKVKLSTSLGLATDGGVTDGTGHTLGWVISGTPGDADVVAALGDAATCEGALSPVARVTFNAPPNITELFPNAPASYFDGDIGISPEPVIQGAPTTVSARLTNPLTAPITVDVQIGYAQAGIALEFGDIHDFVGQVIPAKSSVTLTTLWHPPISGHYCLQVNYTITGAGLALPAAGSSGSKQRNLNAFPGGTGAGDKPDALERTKLALDLMNGFIGNAFDTDPFDLPLRMVNAAIFMQLETTGIINTALGLDPPRADYNVLASPHVLELPPEHSTTGLSPARAAALNALNDTLARANADGQAAATALDRSGGASEAGNLQWASIQAAAVIQYNKLMGMELITASTQINNLLDVAASENVTTVVISTSDVISMQQQLKTGFSVTQTVDAHGVGISDAQLEVIRKEIMDEGPEELAGDVVVKLRRLSAEFNALGNVLAYPVAFQPQHGIGGGVGLLAPTTAAASGNTLVHLASSSATVQLRNPLTATTAIDVRTRRIDLPADWSASASPGQVTLAPGQITTVTVSVLAGSPLLQGSLPQVAVEGYAGSQLLGGVVVEIVAPNYVFFDGSLHLYLPLVRR